MVVQTSQVPGHVQLTDTGLYYNEFTEAETGHGADRGRKYYTYVTSRDRTTHAQCTAGIRRYGILGWGS